MPCSGVSTRPPCTIFASESVQRRMLAMFLCRVNLRLDEAFQCDVQALATATEGVCIGSGTSRQIQAANISEGFDIAATTLDCYPDSQIEQMIAQLQCNIINIIEPE